MKERPIIFSDDSVRAILEGRKTQTRRVIKIPEGIAAKYEYKGDDGGNELLPKQSGHYWMNGYAMWRPKLCPYGKVGDRLWVRETFAYMQNLEACARAGEPCEIAYKADQPKEVSDEDLREVFFWKPSIFMPKWAARTWLEITNIRVERLCEISEEDAKAEGVTPENLMTDYDDATDYQRYKYSFKNYWDSLNAKRGFGWETNNWVWVIEFQKVEPQRTQSA